MDLDQDVSVVALIVSLIAFFVSFLMMIQTFMATADGFRRCGPSVIGPWSKFRHRHWIWLEFRYETRFVTPEIILASPAQVKDIRAAGLPVYALDGCKPIEGTVLHSTIAESRVESTQPAGKASTRQDLVRIEKNITPRLFQNTIALLSSKKPDSETTEQDMRVSWLRLLQDTHKLYQSYFPEGCGECSTRQSQPHSSDHSADAEKVSHIISHDGSDSEIAIDHLQPIIATIIYRSWTWDFLPPDTVKPFAKSTIGDIVVLAQRLGMRWRTIKITEGMMQADGNGLALSSRATPNLGMVFTFDTGKAVQKFPKIVPSKAVNQFLCGILPGDPDLVKDDFVLVNEARTVINVSEPTGIFQLIGLKQAYLNKTKHLRLPEPCNEAIILLLPFMPIPGSDNVEVYSSAAFGQSNNLFQFWEGRLTMLKALQIRIKECKTSHSQIETLEKVQKFLETLEEEYRDDFYLKKNQALDDDSGTRRSQIVEYCRGIFNTTTAYFAEKLDGYYEGRTKYTVLVAAHVRMSIDTTWVTWEKYSVGKPQDYYYKEYTANFPYLEPDRQGYQLSHILIEYAKAYTYGPNAGILSEEHGIASYLNQHGISFDTDVSKNRDMCEALWWMLMIRGVSWTMSCRYGFMGPPVPALCYGNKTPVWIT